MNTELWIGVIVTLILFLLLRAYEAGYKKGRDDGYILGATKIIREWKNSIVERENENGEA